LNLGSIKELVASLVEVKDYFALSITPIEGASPPKRELVRERGLG
jgi:hypothetical protein